MRELIQDIANAVWLTNKAFEQKDKEENDYWYKKLRDLIAKAELGECKVNIAETWESGLVTCEVEVEGVHY